jgi:zinc and cadmium transporter
VRLGVLASLAVLAHEIPHHVGDLVVLRQAQRGIGRSARSAAFVKVSLAGAVTTVGGVAGYFLLAPLEEMLPYFLTVASSSFIYVALADLIPQLQRKLTTRQTFAQVVWLLGGVVVVTLMAQLSTHSH